MTRCLIAIAIITTVCVFPRAAANHPDLAAWPETCEQPLAALNRGHLDGFLDAVRNEALSLLSRGPTSGTQIREACAPDRRHTLGYDAGDRRPTHGRCGSICAGCGCDQDDDGVF